MFNQPSNSPADDLMVSGSVTSGVTLLTQDTTGYASLSFQITSGGSGNTLLVEQSNDNTNWVQTGVASALTAYQATTAGATSGLFSCPIVGRYARIRCSVYGSGTVSVVAAFRATTTPSAALSQGAPASIANSWFARLTPVANSGQLTHIRVTAAGSTNATNVKNAQGNVFGWSLSNTSAAVKYFKFYNKASAPTVGTDTPVLTIVLPAGQTVSFQTPVGLAMTQTGISYAITGAAADSDTTSVTAGDVTGAIWYL